MKDELEMLSDFIDEDGYFSFRSRGRGEMEISCSDGVCSIEVFKVEDNITLEGAAENADELYDAIEAGASELVDDEDVSGDVEMIIYHMYRSVADDDEDD